MKFTPPIFHPNGKQYAVIDDKLNYLQWKTVVYDDGNVCISILHPPGDDPLMYERSSERWSPIQSVEKVLLSVISMLAEPNIESPANIGEFNL